MAEWVHRPCESNKVAVYSNSSYVTCRPIHPSSAASEAPLFWFTFSPSIHFVFVMRFGAVDEATFPILRRTGLV